MFISIFTAPFISTIPIHKHFYLQVKKYIIDIYLSIYIDRNIYWKTHFAGARGAPDKFSRQNLLIFRSCLHFPFLHVRRRSAHGAVVDSDSAVALSMKLNPHIRHFNRMSCNRDPTAQAYSYPIIRLCCTVLYVFYPLCLQTSSRHKQRETTP